MFILAAATAEDDQKRNNNKPDPIILKQIAQTVIHKTGPTFRVIIKSCYPLAIIV